MERKADLDEARIATLRDAYQSESADDDLAPEARRTREELFPGSRVVAGDDLELCGEPSFTVRAVCAGRGADCIAVYMPEWFGDELLNLFVPDPAIMLTDRAPLEAEQDGLPIYGNLP